MFILDKNNIYEMKYIRYLKIIVVVIVILLTIIKIYTELYTELYEKKDCDC
jgi:hypothetical protein